MFESAPLALLRLRMPTSSLSVTGKTPRRLLARAERLQSRSPGALRI